MLNLTSSELLTDFHLFLLLNLVRLFSVVAGHVCFQNRADVESRWRHRWQLPLFTGRARLEQELQDSVKGFISIGLAHKDHD